MAAPDLDSLTRKFLYYLKEGRTEHISVSDYIQALGETLSFFKVRTLTEQRRMAIAKQQLKEIKRHTKKLQEQVFILEEKLNILEENREG